MREKYRTGDLKNSQGRALRSMRACGIQTNDMLDCLAVGSPAGFVTLIRRLLGSSRTAISQASARGVLPSSHGRKVLVAAYDLLRELAHFRPAITVEQFLRRGMFAEHKLHVLTALAEHLREYGSAPEPGAAAAAAPPALRVVIVQGGDPAYNAAKAAADDSGGGSSGGGSGGDISDAELTGMLPGSAGGSRSSGRSSGHTELPPTSSPAVHVRCPASPADGILIRRPSLEWGGQQRKAQGALGGAANAVNSYASVLQPSTGDGSGASTASSAKSPPPPPRRATIAAPLARSPPPPPMPRQEEQRPPLQPPLLSQSPSNAGGLQLLGGEDSFTRLYQRRQMIAWAEEEQYRQHLRKQQQHVSTDPVAGALVAGDIMEERGNASPESSLPPRSRPPSEQLQLQTSLVQAEARAEKDKEAEAEAAPVTEKEAEADVGNGVRAEASLGSDPLQSPAPLKLRHLSVSPLPPPLIPAATLPVQFPSGCRAVVAEDPASARPGAEPGVGGFADSLLSRLEGRLQATLGAQIDSSVQRAVDAYRAEQRCVVKELAADVDSVVRALQLRLEAVEGRLQTEERARAARDDSWKMVLG